MTRHVRGSLLIASMIVVLWATSSDACHRRRACPPQPCGGGYAHAQPSGYYVAGGGYAMPQQGYYDGGMAAYPMAQPGYYDGSMAGYPAGYGYGGYGYGGYGYGRPYNPGGLGGPMSGLGIRPGLGFGGLGRGR